MKNFDLEKLQAIAKNIDERPALIWEGELQPGLSGRVILTKKNTFVVEQNRSRDALGSPVWEMLDLRMDAVEALSKTLKMILEIEG